MAQDVIYIYSQTQSAKYQIDAQSTTISQISQWHAFILICTIWMINL